MKAVIMAGGAGTRLRPLTSNLPKPMVPLVNRPMMEHVVRLLARHGFDEVVMTLAFLPNAIRSYFGDGSDFGVRIVYATEETPLGTAGSVRNASGELDERFLVISGDVLTDIDLSAIVASHDERGALATIGLTVVENPLDFGIVITRDDGSIERFLEKPTWGQVFSDTINTGIFVFEPEIFDYIEAGRPVDFSNEVFPAVLADGRPLYGYVADGHWEDVGTLDAYVRAHADVLDGKVELDIPGFQLRDDVWLGEGAEVHGDARVDGPAVIGSGCRVGAGARIGPYTVLGRGVTVGADADLERSVIFDNTYVGATVGLRGTVVGRSCDLRRGVHAEEGVVIGDECFLGEDAHLASDVKVFPFKTVEAGATINSSIVWESKGARGLFGRSGVEGLANVDITPELATKVAMAWAATLGPGARVAVSRDSSRTARMLKRAVMVGLNATGVDVDDLELAPIPLTRFQTRARGASGGVTVRLEPGEAEEVRISFFDGDGVDVDEKAQRGIERLYHREDFSRVPGSEVGDITFAGRAIERYTESLEEAVDVAAIRECGFKVVLDYAYGSVASVMATVLGKLGADVLAVNPYAATEGLVRYDRDVQARRVGDLVLTSGAHLGAVFNPNGDRITFVHDGGEAVPDEVALLMWVDLLAATRPGIRIGVPLNASSRVEALAAQRGAEVVWTKLGPSAQMRLAADGEVDAAVSLDGGVMIGAFLPAYDACAAFVTMLGVLASDGRLLSKIVADLPVPHVVHRTVVTPWEQKGLVMRTLVERSAGRDVVLLDGVKVRYDSGWVLALPDPVEPVTHLWAESDDEGGADRLADEYARRVAELMR